MFINVCRFNPAVDNEAVSQIGCIDLYKAYETHTIPTILDDVDVAYNDIEDPSSILGKPTDIFEATRQLAYINEAGRKDTGESEVA